MSNKQNDIFDESYFDAKEIAEEQRLKNEGIYCPFCGKPLDAIGQICKCEVGTLDTEGCEENSRDNL